MSTQAYCAFCQISGIAGPHDHFVRETRDPNSAVRCPLLLATECSFCHTKGHTAKYCGKRKEMMSNARNARNACVKKNNVSSEEGLWMSQPRRRMAKPTRSPNRVEIEITAGGFAQLDLENSSDSEQDNAAGVIPQSETKQRSWADITKQNVTKENVTKENVTKENVTKENVTKQTYVKSEPVVNKQTVDKRPSGMSWADWDDDDEDEDEDDDEYYE